MYFGEPYLIDV